MRLHRRLGDAELVGDLLVEQPFRQHHQHAHLLRRQRRHARHQFAGLAVGADAQIDVRRRPHAAAEHARDRVAHLLDAERLGDEARGAEIHAAADDGGIVVGRHHHHRHARILRAQVHQAGKAAHARHRQIEQDEIDVAAALEQFGDLVEGSGLGDFDLLQQAGHRLAQRAAEQRMIVGNHQAVVRPVTQVRRILRFDRGGNRCVRSSCAAALASSNRASKSLYLQSVQPLSSSVAFGTDLPRCAAVSESNLRRRFHSDGRQFSTPIS